MLAPGMAQAAETISYSYDVHGRLIGWTSSGTINNNLRGATFLDSASNITKKTVTQLPAARMTSTRDAAGAQAANSAPAPAQDGKASTGARPAANEAPAKP